MDKLDRIIRENLYRTIAEDNGLEYDRLIEEGISKKELAGLIAAGVMNAGAIYNAYNREPRTDNETQQEVVVDDRYEDEKYDNMDDSYLMKFINHSENPDSAGYDRSTDRWYAPSGRKFDSWQYGMGTDIRHNGADKLLKKDENGKKYMTAEDERKLRHKNVEEMLNSFKQRLAYAKKVTGEQNFRPSEAKRAMTVSAIYCKGGKRVAKEMFTPENCQIFVYGSDYDWAQAVKKFYKRHKVSSRYDREMDFIAQNQQEV